MCWPLPVSLMIWYLTGESAHFGYWGSSWDTGSIFIEVQGGIWKEDWNTQLPRRSRQWNVSGWLIKKWAFCYTSPFRVVQCEQHLKHKLIYSKLSSTGRIGMDLNGTTLGENSLWVLGNKIRKEKRRKTQGSKDAQLLKGFYISGLVIIRFKRISSCTEWNRSPILSAVCMCVCLVLSWLKHTNQIIYFVTCIHAQLPAFKGKLRVIAIKASSC